MCLATLLDTNVSNPMEYEFNFQLEIRGPCLLAGERELPRSRETLEGIETQGGEGFRPKAARVRKEGEGGEADELRWKTA